MALKEAGRTKIIVASGGGTLVAAANESLRVRDVFCVPSTNDTYVTLSVSGRPVLKLRAKGKAGNHIPFPAVKTAQLYEAPLQGLMSWLAGQGIDLTIPVECGETLSIARYAEAGRVGIVYDAYDKDDVKPTEPNGREAKIFRYLHYLTNSAAITSSPTTLDISLMWAGGEAWPVGGIEVPSRTSIKLLGIFGCPSARGNASANKGLTEYLRLLQEGDPLFDDSADGSQGLPFLGDVAVVADAETYYPVASVIGPRTATIPEPPLIFGTPLTFADRDKLTVQVATSGALAAGIAAAGLDVALLLEVTKL